MMKVSFSSSPRRIGEVEVIVKGGRRRWSSWISPGRDERRRIRKESLASGGLPLVCLHEGKGARKGIASQAGTTMRSGVCTPVVTVHPPGVCTAQPHSGTLPSLGNLFSPCFFSTGRNVRGNLHVFLPGLPHTSCRESTLPSSPPPRPFKLRSQHLSRITLASSSPHFFSPLIPLGHSLTHRLSSSSLRSSLTSASLTCRSLSSSTSAPSPVSSSSSSSPPPPSPTLCSPPSPPSSSSSPSSSPPSSSSSSSSSSFRVLWVLTEGERVRLFLAFIALLLSSAAQLIIPFYLGKLIDRFSSSSPSSSPFASSSCSSEASSSLSSSNEFLSQSSSLSPPSDSSASSSPPESLHIQPSSLSSASTADFLPPPSPTTITTTPQRSLAEGERREDEEEDQDEKKEKKKRFFSQASQALLEASGSTVQASATACGALILLGVLTSYLRLFLLETSIERVANQLRRKYFARLLAEPTERFSKESSGILLNRLSTEITQSSRIFIDVSFGLKCLFSTTVGLGAASSLAPPSFLLSLLCPIAVSGFLFRLTARKSRRLQAEQSRALSHAVHHASEVLQNRRLVRALNAEMLENRNFERQLAAVYKVARRNAIAVGCRHGLVFACGGGFLLHIIQQAGILISAGTLSLGDISALAIYCLMTGSSLQGCVTAYSDVHRTLGIASNLLHSLSSSPLQSSLSLDKKDKKKESSIEVLKDKEEEIFSLKISGDTGNNGLASQPPAREERRGDLCKSSSSFSPRERNLPDHERIRDSLSSFSADENDGMEAHRDTAVLRSLGREKKGVFSKEKKDMINVSRSSFMEDTASGDSHSIPLEPRGRKDTTEEEREEEREEEEEERRGVDVMLRDVWFSYPDQKTPWSLRGVTLHIPAASRWAILGTSGSGKSTLMSLLLRLYEPTRGDIFLDGLACKSLDARLTRSMISYVSQENLLFARSVRENLFYAVHANDLLANTTTSSEVLDERLHAVAEISQIESFLKDLPHGYETLLDEKGYSLSGGQRQRLCTARALCRFPRLSSSPASTPPSSPLSPSSSSPLSSLSRSGHVEKREKFEASPTPRLFLMDEGTSAVDVLTEEKIFTRLKHALRGYTSLLITHRLSALDFASHIAVMDEGRLIQSGKKEEVLAQPSQHLQHILVCSSRPLDISTDSQQTYSSSTSGSIIHPSPSILGNGEGLPVSTSPSSS